MEFSIAMVAFLVGSTGSGLAPQFWGARSRNLTRLGEIVIVGGSTDI
ncbi:MAG: hypothetical protein GXP35_03845 [Actinobacteria bacterium]|nr:hypothetical protein [Actinomycetota bacterium]